MPLPILSYSSIPPSRSAWPASVSFAVLLALTLLFALLDGEQEPYFGPIRAWQLLLIVGGGSVLLVSWTIWSFWIGWAVNAKRIHGYWIFAVFFSLVLMAGIAWCIGGYVRDITASAGVPGPGASPSSRGARSLQVAEVVNR